MSNDKDSLRYIDVSLWNPMSLIDLFIKLTRLAYSWSHVGPSVNFLVMSPFFILCAISSFFFLVSTATSLYTWCANSMQFHFVHVECHLFWWFPSYRIVQSYFFFTAPLLDLLLIDWFYSKAYCSLFVVWSCYFLISSMFLFLFREEILAFS